MANKTVHPSLWSRYWHVAYILIDGCGYAWLGNPGSRVSLSLFQLLAVLQGGLTRHHPCVKSLPVRQVPLLAGTRIWPFLSPAWDSWGNSSVLRSIVSTVWWPKGGLDVSLKHPTLAGLVLVGWLNQQKRMFFQLKTVSTCSSPSYLRVLSPFICVSCVSSSSYNDVSNAFVFLFFRPCFFKGCMLCGCFLWIETYLPRGRKFRVQKYSKHLGFGQRRIQDSQAPVNSCWRRRCSFPGMHFCVVTDGEEGLFSEPGATIHPHP